MHTPPAPASSWLDKLIFLIQENIAFCFNVCQRLDLKTKYHPQRDASHHANVERKKCSDNLKEHKLGMTLNYQPPFLFLQHNAVIGMFCSHLQSLCLSHNICRESWAQFHCLLAWLCFPPASTPPSPQTSFQQSIADSTPVLQALPSPVWAESASFTGNWLRG